MSEIERLVSRLKAHGVTNFHVSWGDEAHKLTPEERARELNRAMDAVERGEYYTTELPRPDRQVDVREWLANRLDPLAFEAISK